MMRINAWKKLLLIACCVPVLALSMSEQTQSAIKTTKDAAKQWEEIAKQKLQQGEAAAKREWPKIKQKSKQQIENAKQQWQPSQPSSKP